jgi:hypothetical protein
VHHGTVALTANLFRRIVARRSSDATEGKSTLDFGTIAHPFPMLTAFPRSPPTDSIFKRPCSDRRGVSLL